MATAAAPPKLHRKDVHEQQPEPEGRHRVERECHRGQHMIDRLVASHRLGQTNGNGKENRDQRAKPDKQQGPRHCSGKK